MEKLKNISVDLLKKYNIVFSEYFREEIKLLDDFVKDSMLIFANNSIKVTFLGRIFIRHICKVFDKYLKGDKIDKVSGP